MNEEKYIEEKAGKRNPFLVPEDYFDGLASQVMRSLPERKPRAKSVWLRPVYYAVAGVCALFVSAAVWMALPERGAQEQSQMAEVRQESGDAFFDEAADYVMLDNQDIYAYLADY